MKVTVKFEIDLPETFVIEKEQPFDFGMGYIRYEKAVAKNCSVVYKRTPKDGDAELVSLEEAAKEYFLAKTTSDMNPETTTYLKEDMKTSNR